MSYQPYRPLLLLPLLLAAACGPTALPTPTSNTPFLPQPGAPVSTGNGTKLGTVYVSPNQQEVDFMTLLNEVRTQGTVNRVDVRAGTCLEHWQAGTLKPLTYNGPLAFASRKHSTYLGTWGYEGHLETNSSHPNFYGADMSARAKRAYMELTPGETRHGGSEIVTAGPDRTDATQAVQAFLRSPGHCQAIIDPHVTSMGTGYALGVPGKNGSLNVYAHNWTANFGY